MDRKHISEILGIMVFFICLLVGCSNNKNSEFSEQQRREDSLRYEQQRKEEQMRQEYAKQERLRQEQERIEEQKRLEEKRAIEDLQKWMNGTWRVYAGRSSRGLSQTVYLIINNGYARTVLVSDVFIDQQKQEILDQGRISYDIENSRIHFGSSYVKYDRYNRDFYDDKLGHFRK